MLLLRKIYFQQPCFCRRAVFCFSGAVSSRPLSVETILVEGNERVTDAYPGLFAVKTGDEIDLQALDQAMGSLFSTNLFENVSISRSGNQVIIEIVENPSSAA